MSVRERAVYRPKRNRFRQDTEVAALPPAERKSLLLTLLDNPDATDSLVEAFGDAPTACHQMGKLLMTVPKTARRNETYKRVVEKLFRLHYGDDYTRLIAHMCTDVQRDAIGIGLSLTLGPKYQASSLSLRTPYAFFDLDDEDDAIRVELTATGGPLVDPRTYATFGLRNFTISHDASWVDVGRRPGGRALNLPALIVSRDDDGNVSLVRLGAFHVAQAVVDQPEHVPQILCVHVDLLPENLVVQGDRVGVADARLPIACRITFSLRDVADRELFVSRRDAMNVYKLFSQMDETLRPDEEDEALVIH